MSLPELSVELLVAVLFLLAFAFQMWYYFGVFGKVAFYKKAIPGTTPPVSIIICARNEDDNLEEFLPIVLQQEYPEFEVVVVNDCSYDNTGDVLEELGKRFSRLKIITIKEDDNHSHGKKFALMVGIKGARYNHLLLTDADCKPSSAEWLKNMTGGFSEEKQIVLGYGGYEKLPGFINKLIRFDTFYVALQYLGFALAGKPYMGVGRNLAYTKSLFFKNKGFASHYHIESGDDDLFINEVAGKKNTNVVVDLSSLTISKVKRSFKAWVVQKRRHITTFKLYNPASKLRLFILGLSQHLFYILFVALLAMQYEIYLILSLFFFRFLIQMLIFNSAMKKLGEKDLLILAPAMEILLMFFYPLLGFTNLFIRKNKWIR